jgi:uncharacterized protein involved in exopolysaccharide biosynthesis
MREQRLGPPASEGFDEVSLADLLQVLRRSYKAIAAIALACGLLAAAAAFLMTPIYRSQVLLAPVPEAAEGSISGTAGQLADLAGFAGLDLRRSGGKEEAVALLRSRILVERFIQEHDLLPVLFPEEWDSGQKAWAVDDPEEAPTLGDAYEFFDERIRRVEEDRKTGLVMLTIEWRDRQLAAAWANALVASVNRYTRQRAVQEAEKSLDYLNRELAKTNVVGIQQVLYRLIEAEVKNITLANVREEYSFRVVDPPAIADADAYIKPQRALIIALGLLLGALGAITGALAWHSLKEQRQG